jgi:hypothetical protein
MPDEDDAALSWDGGSDSTHVDFPQPDAEVASDETGLATGTSSAMVGVYGVFGGIFLLYTVGWMLIAIRGSQSTGVALTDFMLHLSSLLAIAAAPAWFIAALWLTVGRANWSRIVPLVIGVLVLVPWGFVSGVSR